MTNCTRPACRWYGGKWQLGKWILSHFPKHSRYIEPFGGMFSVGLQKPEVSIEIYNDLHAGAVNFWTQLRDNPQILISQIENLKYDKFCYEWAVQKSADDSSIEQALKFYAECLLSYPGGGLKNRGGTSTARLSKVHAHNHLYAIATRIKNLQIYSLDALEVIKKFDNPNTLVYCDPCYVRESRNTHNVYRHEMDVKQHIQIAQVLREVSGHVIISGYKSELYENLFAGWQRQEHVNYTTNRRKKVIECLWIKPTSGKKCFIAQEAIAAFSGVTHTTLMPALCKDLWELKLPSVLDMVPFCVVDRPINLHILKGLPLQNYPGVSIGIMANANTSLNFQRILQHYPCDDFNYCHAVGGACPHQDDISRCSIRQHILKHTVKMCDSGIFTREGATLTYDQLFAAYARMGVDYGIMIDVLQDSQATLESARSALTAYKPYQDKFNLVGVAQGTGVEEYLDCYTQLKQLGFQYVAVGGLLKKTPNTVRYVSVRNEEFMFQVLEEIRRQYPDDWLFALGCFSLKRLDKLQSLGVWADSKAWLFKYQPIKGGDRAVAQSSRIHETQVNLGKVFAQLVTLQQSKTMTAIYSVETAKLQFQISEFENQMARLRQQLEAFTRAERIASKMVTAITSGLEELQGLEVDVEAAIARLKAVVLKLFPGDGSDNSPPSGGGNDGAPPKPPSNDPLHNEVEEKGKKLLESSGSLKELEDSGSQLRKSEALSGSSQSKSTTTPNEFSGTTGQIVKFTQTFEIISPSPVQLTLFLEDSPAQGLLVQGEEKDSKTNNLPFGGKCSGSLVQSAQDSSSLKTQKVCDIEDLERLFCPLPKSGMWANGSVWRQPTLELPIVESGFLSLPTLTASARVNSRPAGQTKCEQWFKKEKLLSGQVLSAQMMGLLLGFPPLWTMCLSESHEEARKGSVADFSTDEQLSLPAPLFLSPGSNDLATDRGVLPLAPLVFSDKLPVVPELTKKAQKSTSNLDWRQLSSCLGVLRFPEQSPAVAIAFASRQRAAAWEYHLCVRHKFAEGGKGKIKKLVHRLERSRWANASWKYELLLEVEDLDTVVDVLLASFNYEKAPSGVVKEFLRDSKRGTPSSNEKFEWVSLASHLAYYREHCGVQGEPAIHAVYLGCDSEHVAKAWEEEFLLSPTWKACGSNARESKRMQTFPWEVKIKGLGPSEIKRLKSIFLSSAMFPDGTALNTQKPEVEESNLIKAQKFQRGDIVRGEKSGFEFQFVGKNGDLAVCEFTDKLTGQTVQVDLPFGALKLA